MEKSSTESPQPVKRTGFPTAAGILTIIAGALNLIAGLIVAAIGGTIASLAGWWDWGMEWGVSPAVLSAIGAPLIVIGIIAIVGGVFAIKRKIWGLALAGAIFALFPPPLFVLGLLAIIFIAISRKEFDLV